MTMVKLIFGPAKSKNDTKEVLSGTKLFGSGTVSYMDGDITVSALKLIDSRIGGGADQNSYVITKTAASMGGAFAFAIIFVVAALIIFGFVATLKTKNQLGVVMGSGCMMWLTVNALFNICVGFGLLPSFYHTSFLPFISNHKVVASYALLGIILSIYKYKNAYPKHIDISIRNNIKVFDHDKEFDIWKNT